MYRKLSLGDLDGEPLVVETELLVSLLSLELPHYLDLRVVPQPILNTTIIQFLGSLEILLVLLQKELTNRERLRLSIRFSIGWYTVFLMECKGGILLTRRDHLREHFLTNDGLCFLNLHQIGVVPEFEIEVVGAHCQLLVIKWV